MQRFVAILLALILPSCASVNAAQPEASLIGCYTGLDKVGYNALELRLNANHSYAANLQGDVGSWANAYGSWSVKGRTIVLSPSGGYRGLNVTLLTLTTAKHNGQLQLIPGNGWYPLAAIRCPSSTTWPLTTHSSGRSSANAASRR